MTESMIALRGVSHSYETQGTGEPILAIENIDLQVPEGQFLTVVGPSGCGKSTMLKLLAGFEHPTVGKALHRGQEINQPGADRGVVFQQPNLYPWFNVLDNVALGLELRGIPKRERRAQAREHLELVGLTDFEDARPFELSGGMQQRAQIARVLTLDPEVILMDEPFGALDTLTREKLQADLLEIQRAERKTVFFITHSVEEAIFLGDRVLVMAPRPGRIKLDVPVELSAHAGRILGPEMKTMPEFISLREEIASAIE